MFDYVYTYTDHAQYTIKTYAKMALFPLLLTGPLSTSREHGVSTCFPTIAVVRFLCGIDADMHRLRAQRAL